MEEGARETTVVTEDERHAGLLEDPVMDKRVLFWYCHDFCEHVSEPDWVDEVEVIETPQVVIVVKENAIVVKELSSCKRLIGQE